MTVDPLARVAQDLDPGRAPQPETKALPAAETTTSSGDATVELFTTDQSGKPWNSTADFGPVFVVILGIALFLVVRGCTAEDDSMDNTTAPSSPATSTSTSTPWCSPGWAPHPDDPQHCHPEEWRDKPLPEGTRGSFFDRTPTADPWSNVPPDRVPNASDFPDPTGPYFPTETDSF